MLQKILAKNNGFLPTYYKPYASCLINFRTLRIRDCMITFDNKEILNSLFKGLYTPPELELRGYIVSPANKERTKYYIQLGNNRFILTLEEVKQLSDLIDDFSIEYFKCIAAVEELLGIRFFKKSKREGGFRLLKIKKELWYMIDKFTHRFDSSKGDSEWHIFDSNSYMIKVYTPHKTNRYDGGYHAIIRTEQEDEHFCDPFYPNNEDIWLVWSPLRHFNGRDNVNDINERRCWDAITTYKWLVNEFIPYVIYYYDNEKKNGLKDIFRNHSFEHFNKNLKISNYIALEFVPYIKTEKIPNLQALLLIAERLQAFFSTSYQVYLETEQLKNLYFAVSLCLFYTPLNEYRYISGNLAFSDKSTLEGILEDIDKYINEIQGGVVDSYTIDTALRCIVVPLRDFKSNLNERLLNRMFQCLHPLVDIYNRQMIINKFK